MGLKNLVKRMVNDKNNIRYESALEKRRISYSDWICEFESANPLEEPSGEESLSGQEEPYLIFRSPFGKLSEDAKAWIGRWFALYPDALMVYGDEDVWPQGEERRSPCFKPGWSPDLLDTRFYLGNLVAVRRDWFENWAKDTWENKVNLPGEPERDEIVAYHSFLLHCARLAGGYEKGRGRRTILHIPRILFHCLSEEDRDRWMTYEEGELSSKDRAGGEKHGTQRGSGMNRRLSVIIPSRDNPDLLEKCILSIMNTTHELSYEIVVVDNGSAPENRARIEEMLKKVRHSGAKGLTLVLYHYEPMDFNFSKMCNLGAKKASGEFLLFLNDDVELAKEGTLYAMAELASRPFTGAVGLKLLYPDAGTVRQIQHIGITNLPMGPVHKLQFCRDEDESAYYMGWNRGRHNALAVTAACLMVEKEKFQEIGGFAQELAVAFNDVEFCFRLYERGYENVCECDHFAWHAESYSRGDDEAPEKLERLLAEREKLYKRHPGLDASTGSADADPYYSVFLNREGLDTRIRPAYETAGNTRQPVHSSDMERFTTRELDALREDPCLIVRVESAQKNEGDGSLQITGWGVVLGDNNACYDKYLILRGEQIYGVLLQGQYRPDLTENMPDQEKVGLSGFMVSLAEDALPAGKYRVGMAAMSRIGRTKLLNFSSRSIRIEGGPAPDKGMPEDTQAKEEKAQEERT